MLTLPAQAGHHVYHPDGSQGHQQNTQQGMRCSAPQRAFPRLAAIGTAAAVPGEGAENYLRKKYSEASDVLLAVHGAMLPSATGSPLTFINTDRCAAEFRG